MIINIHRQTHFNISPARYINYRFALLNLLYTPYRSPLTASSGILMTPRNIMSCIDYLMPTYCIQTQCSG